MSAQILVPTAPVIATPNIKVPLTQNKQLATGLTREELIETVANLLEDILTERCTRYASLDEIPAQTLFHAKKLPAISIKDYMTRFGTYSNCHENVFVLALIFIDKLGEMVPDFCLDSFNVHRTLLLSMVLACKSYDDAYYKNSYYAKIGGVALEEFNSLEIEYLVNYVDFKLYVDDETYNSYYEDLVNFHQDHNDNNNNQKKAL